MKSMAARRFLAFLVSVAMVVTLTPTYAFADVIKADPEGSGQVEQDVGELGQASEDEEGTALPAPEAEGQAVDEGAVEEEAEPGEDAGQEEAEPGEAAGQEEAAPSSAEEAQTEDMTAPAPKTGKRAEVKGDAQPISNVPYLNRSWDGSKVTTTQEKHDALPLPASKSVQGGWYYLDRNVTVDGRMCFDGDTQLILGNNKKLDVKGLHIPKGFTLTIFAQSSDDTVGTIYSHPGSGAAIGAYSGHKGGNVVIHGGNIEAKGGDNCAGIGGNDGDLKDIGSTTIYAGLVNATGGDDSAGIGGGRACEGGEITIYGGTVIAEGKHYGAGIGGGNGQDTNPLKGAHAGTITINGGTVTATGGDDAAGIGGGEGGNAGTIEINGGTVTAQGGNYSAGIGCGEGESTGVGGTVTITGGTVTATGGKNAAGIGGGEDGSCNTITISGGTETTKVTATGGSNGAGIGAGRDAGGGTIKITGGTVTATGKDSSAGIGGADASGSYADYSNIEISGGIVTATGNSKGAGIGGGEYGHATVIITGGTVKAYGGSSGGSAIGNGKDGSGSAITLGYTDATKADIKITAASYGGNVKLAKPFQNGSKTFRATDRVTDLAGLVANPPLVAWDYVQPTNVQVASWTELQSVLNNATSEVSVKLTEPVSANGESAIIVPTGVTATLDLNGKTLDRQLDQKADGGSAIIVEQGASLTVRDSSHDKSGVITGGYAANGGGIYNEGTLKLEGGTVSGNRADGSGGGVYNAGKLTMTSGNVSGNTATEWGGGIHLANGTNVAMRLSGGTISANTCGNNGGGIHVSGTASLSVSGNLSVTDNQKGEVANNVSLADGAFVGVVDPLSVAARIGVRMSDPSGNITSGLSGKGSADNFLSDNSGYTVAIDGGGEAYLYKEADKTASSWSELQTKINSAESGTIIQLTDDVVNTENKTRIQVDNKNVTIDLNGHTVDRNRSSSDGDGHVFELKNGAKLTIRDNAGGGKITGGYAKRGGGIHIHEGCTCTITGGSITGNKASVDGGGVYVRGTLKMTGGAVSYNYADDTGGGIYVNSSGKIDLTGASISQNVADNQGGGIKAHLAKDSSITNCAISYNEADDDIGGGIHLDAKGKKLTITDSNINHNRSDDDGGGIYLQNGTIVMSGGSLSDNYSDNDGGGVKVTGNTTFKASGVTISKNTAKTEEGGGIKNFGTTELEGCDITYNSAKEQGGGIFNDNDGDSEGKLTLSGCTVSGNDSKDNGGGIYSDKKLVLSGGTITGNSSSLRGGGIFIGDDSSDTDISGSLVVKDNGAINGGKDIFLRTHKLAVTSKLTEGAEIGITKENDSGLGKFTSGYSTHNGADKPSLYFFSPEGLEVEASGGEASLASSWTDLQAEITNANEGATITLGKDYTASKKNDRLQIPKNKKLTIDLAGHALNRNLTSEKKNGHVIEVFEGANLTLKDSTATLDQPGSGVITGGYSARGGGIYVNKNATCTITGVVVKNNFADDDGAGIYTKGTLKMSNCLVSDNAADDCGGGIFSEDTSTIELNGVSVTKNIADNDGGGMKLWLGSDSTIENCKVTGNHSEDHGGGLYMEAKGKKLTIKNTSIDENTSTNDGGGIFLYNGTIEMTKGSISKNESDADSGGIKVTSKTTLIADGVTINGNSAGGEEGGGVKNYGTTTLKGCTISGNSAKKEGGGVFNDSDDSAGDLTIDGCTITKNSSSSNGGGIYSDKKLTIKGDTVIGGEDTSGTSGDNGADGSGGTEGSDDSDSTASGDENKSNGNKASGKGGGIFLGSDSKDTEIQGKIIVENNTANNGGDVYLRKGRKLKLVGKITGTKIAKVDMQKGGIFTSGYSTFYPRLNANGSEIAANAPSTFFCKSPSAIPAIWDADGKEARLESKWPELQGLINTAAVASTEAGHVVTLQRNYTAGSGDDRLEIKVNGDDKYKDLANNGHVTIDLNGHILNRNLGSKTGNGHVIEVHKGAVLTIKDSKANTSDVDTDGEDPDAGVICGGYTAKGGGIYVGEGATLNFESGIIYGNYATDHGGGILNYGTLNMTGGYVWNNAAEDNGGGIYSSDSSTLSLKNVVVLANTAGDDGGGLNVRLANDAIIEDCIIQENRAADCGGGLRMDAKGKTLTIKNTTIEENICIDDGAGIYLNSGTITMEGGEKAKIIGNAAFNDGGGVKVTSNTTFNATGVTIEGNRANNEEGGGVKSFGTTTLKSCTIKNNSSIKEGGGIFNDDGKMTLDDCTVTENSSDNNGGGVYSDSELTIVGGTYLGNSSGKRGGGIFIGGGSKDTEVSGKITITGNKAVLYGDDLYLRKGRKLKLAGALSAPASNTETSTDDGGNAGAGAGEGEAPDAATSPAIHVDLESGTGTLAKDYAKNCKTKEGKTVAPETFFIYARGYYTEIDEDGDVVLCSDWKEIKKKIEKAKDGDTITVDKDYAAASSDDRIKVSKDITVDLAGFALNRNRHDETDDGHVLEVVDSATLTLKDSASETSSDENAGNGGEGAGSGGEGDGSGGENAGSGDEGANTGANDDDEAKIGAIMGGWSERGGGIYLNKNTTLNLQGGEIVGNKADTNGGGVFSKGTLTMTGGRIADNSTDGSGGGVYANEDSTISLEGGQITDNDAAKKGGGVYVDEGVTASVAGSPEVFSNHASTDGADVYLSTGRALETGKIAEGAKLGVAIGGHRGAFTIGYAGANKGEDGNVVDPATYFESTEGYTVYLNAGEAELGLKTYGETEYTDPFVSASNQVNTNTDTLGSYNWMSGVSGERYLQEINIPGSHDSGMNNVHKHYNTKAQLGLSIGSAIVVGLAALVLLGTAIATPFILIGASAIAIGFTAATAAWAIMATAVLNVMVPTDWTAAASAAADARCEDMAKTQKEYIYQQLDEGARQLDIRLGNRKKVYKFIGYKVFNGWTWSDDGKNLWVFHGKSGGGSYHADGPDGEYLSFTQVLNWVEDFLEEHPTETVLLDLRPETEKKDEHRDIYARARKILETEALRKNPSTGEAFLYKEPGSNDYFAPYTKMPKLADCRGKIVLNPENDDFIGYVGGFQRDSLVSECVDELVFKNTKEMMADQVKNEYAEINGDGSETLSSTADTYSDKLWYWELNCTGALDGGWYDTKYYLQQDEPYKLARYVNPRVVNDDEVFGSATAGQYIGWVRFDSFEAKYAEPVWRTNFFDGLEYCTVTVKSNLKDPNDPTKDDPNYPDQTYRVLKNTELTLPGNIYKKLPKGTYFGAWKNGDVDYAPGQKYKVSSDVTFEAEWLEGKVPVRVEWKDGDDADGLRPENLELAVTVDGETNTLELFDDEGWSGVVDTAGKEADIAPSSDLVVPTAEAPAGRDVEGQYRYEIELEEGDGYIITLVHTPQAKARVAGKVTWDDNDDEASQRPSGVTVRLFKNGEEAAARTVSANDSGEWEFDFGELALYERGERVDYSVVQDSIEGYGTAVDGFSVTNTYNAGAPDAEQETVDVSSVVEWDDASDAKGIRPGAVLLTLLANGEQVDSQKVAPTDNGFWTYTFTGVAKTDENGAEIAYTIVAEDVDGYAASCEEIVAEEADGATADERASHLWRVAYVLDITDQDKEPAVVTAAPEPVDLVYNGQVRELAKTGEAEGGTMLYALGADGETAPAADAFADALPTATDAGTYFVWYCVTGDVLHTGTEPVCVESCIARAEQEIEADDVEGAAEESGNVIEVTVTGVDGTSGGTGAVSFEVTDGTDVASVDATTGALTLVKAGTATVTVTAGETVNYNAASTDVTVTVTPAMRAVTFYEDAAGTEVWQTVSVVDGRTYPHLGDTVQPPAREGYTFAGWATEPNIVVDAYLEKDEQTLNPELEGKLASWGSAIRSDVDVYPIWIRDRLVVHLDANGDEASPAILGTGADGKAQSAEFTVDIGEKIRMEGLNSTRRAGYELDGWYTSGGVKWDESGEWGVTPEYCDRDASNEPVVQTNELRKFDYYTVTLTARWTPRESGQDTGEPGTYTITFDSLGGTPVGSISQPSGTQIIAPDDPEKPHYSFEGWHPALPETMPTHDLAVTASWEPTVYYAAFYDDDHETWLSSVSGIYGSELAAPQGLERAGYAFAGWVDAGGSPVAFPMYMPDTGTSRNKPTKFFATWKLAQEPPEVLAAALDAYTVEVVDAQDGVEYVIVPEGQAPAAKDWYNASRADGGSDIVFAGLEPATSYEVWARTAATETLAASEAVKADVTTLKEGQVASAAPAVQAAGPSTIAVIGPSEAQEYVLVVSGEPVPEDSAAWLSADSDGKVEWTGLEPGTSYAVYARYKATGTKEASPASLPVVVKTGKAELRVTEPKPLTGLTANGKAQALVKAGSVEGGQMLYALGESATKPPAASAFTATVPTATNAGTYYVWYFAKGDAAHVDSAPACVDVTVAPTPAPTPTPAPSGAEKAERAVLAAVGEKDAAGSSYAPLRLMSKKQAKRSVTLAWSKVKGAKRYVVYGAKCGKKSRLAKVANVGASRKSLAVRAVPGAKGKKVKLAAGTAYRFVVVADMGAGAAKVSKAVHVATKGKKKVSNFTKVKVSKKVVKKAKKLKAGKTLKLKAKAVKKKGTKVRAHAKLRYESTNPKVASVSKKGVVRAKKKGTCYVYAYAQSGIAKKVKVTVR